MNHYGIMFHGFHHEIVDFGSSGTVSANVLDKAITKVGKKSILSPEEWIERTVKGNLPNDSVCLTFDDGLRSQIDFALPVLESHNLKAFWFVNSAPLNGLIQKLDVFRRFRFQNFSTVDEYYELFFLRLNPKITQEFSSQNYKEFLAKYQYKFPFYSINDIKYRFVRDLILSRHEYEEMVTDLILEKGQTIEQLSEEIWINKSDVAHLHSLGHEIGLHSFDHPTNMRSLSISEQRYQYGQNHADLTQIVGSIRSAAHPCGSYSKETLQILKSLGVKVAFNSSLSKEIESKAKWINNLQMIREDIANLK